MIISKCYIAGFGRLNEFEYEFKEGFNSILEENGWGKTTFSVFLKSMFYGLEYAPNKKKVLTERRHYMPWSGGVFGGSLEFATEKGRYRIERQFGKTEKEDSYRLINLDTGRDSEDYADPIGEELFGVDRESFEKTIFIAQSSMETGITDRINTKVGNLSETKDDLDEFETATERIEETKKVYTKNSKLNPGKLVEIRDRIREGKKNAEEIPALEEAFKKQTDILNERKQKLTSLKTDKENLQKDISERGKASQAIGALKEKKEQHEKNQKAIDELENFFTNGIMEDDAIKELENSIQTLSVDKRSISNKENEGIEPEERERLKNLFEDALPSQDELNRWQNQADRIKELRMKRESSRLSPEDEKELKSLKEFFIKGRPTHETITDILRQEGRTHAYDGEADTLRKNIEKLDGEDETAKKKDLQKSRSTRWIMLLLLIIAVLGLATYFLVFKGSDRWFIGLGVTGLAVILMFLNVFRMIGIRNRRARRNKRIENERAEYTRRLDEIESEKDSIRRGIEDFLNLYPTRNKAELMDRVSEVQRQLDRLEHLEKLDSDIMGKSSEALEELSDKQLSLYTALQPFAEKYGMDLFHDMSEQRLLKNLFADRETELARRKTEADMMLLSNRIRENEKDINRILSMYEFPESLSAIESDIYMAKLSYIKTSKERLDTLEKNEAALKEEMENLSKEIPENVDEDTESIDALQEKALQIDEEISDNISFLQKDQEMINETSEKLIMRMDEKDRTEVLEEHEKLLAYRVDILSKAKDYLQKARDMFMAQYMGPLQNGMEHYMSMIYPGINMRKDKGTFELDMDLNVKYRSNGQTMDSQYLSQGYQDMAALSVRFALIDAMYEKEQPAIIMDDPFSGFDRDKVESALSLLKKLGEKRQIIYFTCHPSRS